MQDNQVAAAGFLDGFKKNKSKFMPYKPATYHPYSSLFYQNVAKKA